jgi:hypothetical protein
MTDPGAGATSGLDLGHLDDASLLLVWSEVMRALKERGVIRSANNPVGDYAEAVVAGWLGGELASNSTAGYDLVTDAGERVQIKARRMTPNSRPSHFSPLRGMDDGQHFDSLVGLVLHEDCRVAEAYQAPWDVVRELARWRPRMNAHLLYLRDVRADPRFKPIGFPPA